MTTLIEELRELVAEAERDTGPYDSNWTAWTADVGRRAVARLEALAAEHARLRDKRETDEA